MVKRRSYKPVFAEETFIVNLYGTPAEVETFEELLGDREAPGSVTAIADLVESIKRRKLTGMNWNCCWRCQFFQNCRIRDYRQKDNLPQKCCTVCPNHRRCMSSFQKISDAV